VALVGFIIPILGVILALVAAGISSGVEATTERMKRRRKTINLMVVAAIVLSLGAGIAYFSYYRHVQQENRAKVEAAQQTEQAAQRSKQIDAEVEQNLLNTCLDNVTKWYNDNSTGLHPQAYWDTLNTERAQQVQECQIRYPTQ
jgi:Tfp pilus assembly protein PilE